MVFLKVMEVTRNCSVQIYKELCKILLNYYILLKVSVKEVKLNLTLTLRKYLILTKFHPPIYQQDIPMIFPVETWSFFKRISNTLKFYASKKIFWAVSKGSENKNDYTHTHTLIPIPTLQYNSKFLKKIQPIPIY